MPNGDGGFQGSPMPSGEWAYSHRFLLALHAAATMHAAQRRKGSGVAYVSHLLGTCAIVLEYGGDEDEAIAALLHDAIEDVEPTEQARQAHRSASGSSPSWRAVPTPTPTPRSPGANARSGIWSISRRPMRPSLLVAAADKLHNARSLLIDLRRVGEVVWSRFNASREESLWFYRSAVEVMRANPACNRQVVDELDRTVAEVDQRGSGRAD